MSRRQRGSAAAVIAAEEGRVHLSGDWTLPSIVTVETAVAHFLTEPLPSAADLVVDASAIDKIDSAGAWLLNRLLGELRRKAVTTRLEALDPEAQGLFDEISKVLRVEPPPKKAWSPVDWIVAIGRASENLFDHLVELLAFFGETVVAAIRVALLPKRWRATAIVAQMEQVGYRALPIVGLISFLIGIVLAYQASVQLRRFGADVFVVDLVGLSVLREFGVLLTAIVVAGRSGSAFAAQIGSMKINEEIDAMRTMGLDPIEVLVLPRLVALVITLPLVAFCADGLALLGGLMMSWTDLGIQPAAFFSRLREAVDPWSFWVGLVKAPVFGLVVGLVGCHHGLEVEMSSESLGSRTTRSVVEAIFLVIVMDAAFSIFFNLVGI